MSYLLDTNTWGSLPKPQQFIDTQSLEFPFS